METSRQPETGKTKILLEHGNGLDFILQNEDSQLEADIKTAEKDLGVESSFKYIISEQEELDSKMDISKKGWNRYWVKRLLPELDLLPEKVKEVIIRINQENKFGLAYSEEGEDFRIFIRKKVAAKRFELEKRKIMAELRADFVALDAEKDLSIDKDKERGVVHYNKDSNSLFVEDGGGNKKDITLGDLIGDYAWGIKYKLESDFPKVLRRKIAKTLLVNEVKNKVGQIYDNELVNIYQIALGTIGIPVEFLEKRTKEIQDPMKLRLQIGGVLAEKMVTEFLTRLEYNNPELAMRVEKANALEDTVLKYDFKILLRKRRGIALESEDMPRKEFVENKRNLGIQFTTMLHGHGPQFEKKEASVVGAKQKLGDFESYIKKQVEDVVLVRIAELGNFGVYYKRWLEEDKPSGGPEQYMGREEKLEIFRKVTSGLLDLSESELDKLKI